MLASLMVIFGFFTFRFAKSGIVMFG